MAAAAPTSLSLPLSPHSSLRSLLPSSSPSHSISLSLHGSHPLPLSLTSVHPEPGAIAASSSGCGMFLDDLGLYRLQTLDKFIREGLLGGGWLEIRPMEDGEVDPTVQLLSESFAEFMGMPPRYVSLLAFLVRQYVLDRRFQLPHAAMLIGFYKEVDKEPELVCTAEVSFDKHGANAGPPTPLPPRDFPYICNMAVKKELRRRGIGFQLLKACEELISQMKTNHKIYLHCRVSDKGPLKMYKKADYKILKTDSILVWLSLQRRKHLLVKELRVKEDAPSDNEIQSIAVDNHVNRLLS